MTGRRAPAAGQRLARAAGRGAGAPLAGAALLPRARGRHRRGGPVRELAATRRLGAARG